LVEKTFCLATPLCGAKARAIIYSIVETAKSNVLKPLVYQQHLFEQLLQLADPTDPESLSKLAARSAALPLAIR
jgi:transposase